MCQREQYIHHKKRLLSFIRQTHTDLHTLQMTLKQMLHKKALTPFNGMSSNSFNSICDVLCYSILILEKQEILFSHITIFSVPAHESQLAVSRALLHGHSPPGDPHSESCREGSMKPVDLPLCESFLGNGDLENSCYPIPGLTRGSVYWEAS